TLAPQPPEHYTLSLHDALPISAAVEAGTDMAALNRLSITVKVKYVNRLDETGNSDFEESFTQFKEFRGEISTQEMTLNQEIVKRSEEHTSELQSRENLVCRLLL